MTGAPLELSSRYIGFISPRQEGDADEVQKAGKEEGPEEKGLPQGEFGGATQGTEGVRRCLAEAGLREGASRPVE